MLMFNKMIFVDRKIKQHNKLDCLYGISRISRLWMRTRKLLALTQKPQVQRTLPPSSNTGSYMPMMVQTKVCLHTQCIHTSRVVTSNIISYS